ncbi:hypothetical protein ANN_09815 [Periplaneta americana]|uniref:Uncharacterized protein n=1 Tax=Periplaneta americana TaxID=6978 RepID=A0ABQ8TMP4_PERAM|nr:hypothetical protein ANN_09815 [Periplaneta americana]
MIIGRKAKKINLRILNEAVEQVNSFKYLRENTTREESDKSASRQNSASFPTEPCKSVRRASRELAIPKSTIHDVLHKRLRLHAYKIQLVQKLKPNDLPARYDFASDMLLKIDIENGYLQKVVFSDESTFHVCGIVNRHNCRIWGSENPHVVRELERDSPKINVWCGLTHETVIGPFFFCVENTINGNVYLDMLQHYAIPQIPQGYVFQQNRAPPHYALHVTDHLNECFPQRWIGRGGPTAWPPRSPDLTPLDFFFWGYIKDIVYKTVVADLEDLRRRIVAACATVTPEMLQNAWQELEYRLDICRATREIVPYGERKEYHNPSRDDKELEARIRGIITNAPRNFLQKTVDSITGRLRKFVEATDKAFDRVDWNNLMGILKRIGVDWKERRLFSNLYMKRVKVRIGEEMSERSEIRRGSVTLYGTETWILRRSEEERIEAFEMWIWRRMERVKWTVRIRNEAILERVGEERMMLKLIRKSKRNWLGHWLRRNCLLKDALEGT